MARKTTPKTETTPPDIAGRAYDIWEQEGRPEGRDFDHWIQAEAELTPPAPKAKPASKPAPKTKAAPKAKAAPKTKAAPKAPAKPKPAAAKAPRKPAAKKTTE